MGIWLAAGAAAGSLVIDVQDPALLPNQANQAITLRVSGGDSVTGFNLRAEMGDGLGPLHEPVFQSVSFSGGIWNAYPTMTSGGVVAGAPEYVQAAVIFSATGQQVSANGLIATLVVDTTGIAGGSFQLGLVDTDIGADSAFIGPGGQDIATTVINDTVEVVSHPIWTGSGTNNNWTNAANWDGAAPVAGSPLTFGSTSGTAHATNANDFAPGTSFSAITFTAGAPAYDLTGNSLALAGPVTNLSSQRQTIDLGLQLASGGGTFDCGAIGITVSGAISGSGPLIKAGSGSLVLCGTDTYRGGTTVNAGTLELLSSSALPDGTSLTVGAGGTLIFNPAATGSPMNSATFADLTVSPVPEPGTLMLLTAGATLLAIYRKRRVTLESRSDRLRLLIFQERHTVSSPSRQTTEFS